MHPNGQSCEILDRGAVGKGSMLFSRFVSGTRVVTGVSNKKVAGIDFPGYGAHTDAYPVPTRTLVSPHT